MEGLPGIGPQRAAAYARAGIGSRRQLLYHLPVRFRVRPEAGPLEALEPGAMGAVVGAVLRASVRRRGRRSTVSLKLACEGGGEITALLFNRPYLAKSLPRGTRVWVAGRRDAESDRLLVSDYERLPDGSEQEPVDGSPSPAPPSAPALPLLPVYRLPRGVPPRVHRKALAALLEEVEIEDWRDADDKSPGLGAALAAIHRPESLEGAREARQRLARDEALALSLEVAARRLEHTRRAGSAADAARPASTALSIDDARHGQLLAMLPHAPTAAQARVLDELRHDLSGTALAGEDARPMGRLLQGDVGSGKTMMALYALLAAWLDGRQAALMAPTELLAIQHARELRRLLAEGGVRDEHGVVLVLGGGSAPERRAARESLASGAATFAVGTHGLQSAGVTFADLAVTVVDEQHRFGVRQRARFRNKGGSPHLLVMTATPIPRTLALTAYGELDVSVLDELPPGRSPRHTEYVTGGRQAALWKRLGRVVADGHRGYVVCPSIGTEPNAARGDEADDQAVDHSVAATLESVRRALPDARVAAVHGRMEGAEQRRVLDGFRSGETQVLVATVLIEVGLDVPEATFVVVPDPSRFGLATLHQIRGRVGRGREPGSCYLLGPVRGPTARARVDALVHSDDGFVLAEKDLELRGPGEMLGTRQSGMPSFCVLDPVRDVALLAEARVEALAAARRLGAADLRRLRTVVFPEMELDDENLLAGG